MDRSALLDAWQREERVPFAGWDFSHLRGRMVEDRHPWDYTARAAALLDRASAALDMDTGGGERLLALREHWPPRVVATEGYAPNIPLARERLAPQGAALVAVQLSEDASLPFRDGAFDLVLNRHGAFNPAEVARMLAPGGMFFTEQVHGDWMRDLSAAFDAPPPAVVGSAERYVPRLKAAGLEIRDLQDWTGSVRFSDVGAIVYYLKAVSWTVPSFSVDSHGRVLLQLQERLEAGEPLVFAARLYLIEAGQPA